MYVEKVLKILKSKNTMHDFFVFGSPGEGELGEQPTILF